MYDRGMKTLVVVGSRPMPDDVREVVERGSTSVIERRSAELRGEPVPTDVDRVVLWADPSDHGVIDLARTYSRGASPEGKDTLVVIAPDATALPGVPAAEIFLWPRDEDRLKLAFMTGG